MTEKKKKPGPIKKTYPYEMARQVVRSQGIVSKREYERWWNYNRPNNLPKKPDVVYRRECGHFSWADFLGIKNIFPRRQVKYRSYEECKKFTYTLGLKSSLEWFKFCKNKEMPDDVPKAPMHFYSKKKDWISWRDFLGYDLVERHTYLVNTKKPILYIAKIPNRPFNVIKIKEIVGEKEDLIELQKKENLQFVRCFYLNRIGDDWYSLISNFIKKFEVGEADEYFTPNIADIISELSYSYETIR